MKYDEDLIETFLKAERNIDRSGCNNLQKRDSINRGKEWLKNAQKIRDEKK